MANVPIIENNLYSVAATWNRAGAAQTLEDTKGMAIVRFVFPVPYETNVGIVFDSALVWYNKAGAVQQVKRGLAANIQKEADQLEKMFYRRNR